MEKFSKSLKLLNYSLLRISTVLLFKLWMKWIIFQQVREKDGTLVVTEKQRYF